MTITAVSKGFTFVYVFIWVVRPSLNYTGHGHCLSLELDMFHLFLIEHSFLRGFWGHKDVGFFSSSVSWGMLFHLLVWFVFPALFLGLLCEFVSARRRAQNLPSGWDVTLRTATPTWILWPDLPKGLCFAEDILKVPTLSFQIPKGYLKWNKTIYEESEKSPGEGKHHPLQYSGLENSMECILRGVTKNRTKSDD